jgi:hypothetical protein
MQSVIVTAKAAFSSLTANGTMTAISVGNKLKSANINNPDVITITARIGQQTNTASLLYRAGTSNRYLQGEDSYKLFTGKMDNDLVTTPLVVYTLSSDGVPLEVNTFGESDPIRLGIRTSLKGEITLDFSGTDYQAVSLYDIEKDKTIDLKETPTYTFTKATNAIELNNRFLLTMTGGTGSDDLQTANPILIQTQGKQLQVISNSGLIQRVQLYDLQGRLVMEDLKSSRTFTTTIDQLGVYIVKVQTERGSAVKKTVIGE